MMRLTTYSSRSWTKAVSTQQAFQPGSATPLRAPDLAPACEPRMAGTNHDPDTSPPDALQDDHDAHAVEFIRATGFSSAEADTLLHQWGRNELEEKGQSKFMLYLYQLYQPMPIMIWIAIIIEAAIQNWIDMGILLGIQFANATLGWYEMTKAGDAVAALKASLKPTATVKRDGKWQTIDAALLVPGDLILLGSGSAVPADCVVNHGQIDVDQSALTGESLPVTVHAGQPAKMGSVVVRGETEATVEATGKNTFFGKTASLLQQNDEMGHLQKVLLRIMLVLVAVSFLLCFSAMAYLLVLGESFTDALQFTVVLLVASIPIAIEIVCTTTLALGSRELSTHGAIVTRLAAIEDLAGINMLCSDKTGTLTLNKMVVQEHTPVYVPDMDQPTLLRFAAMAAKWKEPARDALDTLVLGSADLSALDDCQQVDYMPFDPVTKRTEGTIIEHGTLFKITKGAPNVVLQLINDTFVRKAAESQVSSMGRRGIRCLAVAKADETVPGSGLMGPWVLLGLLTFLDPPRPDTRYTVHKAMEYGVDVKMITGDHVLIAQETSRQLGLGTDIKDARDLPSLDADGKVPKNLAEDYGELIMQADGFAQVFPEHKYLIVQCLRRCGFAVAMTGDGVNDAPALKRADCGVAVQGSTDAARAAADIVLTQPGLKTVVDAIVIARCIFQRMKTFINYRIAATLQLLVFFFIAVLALHPNEFHQTGEGEVFPRFFKMPVLMLMLITLLNDGTLISIGYDRVKPSHMPEKWNLKALFLTSIVLGSVACGSSLLLLWAALDSHNPNGLFQRLGLPGMEYGKVTTMVYLKVSVSDFLTLFSARTHEGFFWSSRPSVLLMAAGSTALSLSTILACVWPKGDVDGIAVEGLARGGYTLWPLWIWLYCVVFWFVQDTLKVIAYRAMHYWNVFDINTDLLVNMRESERPDDPEHPLARASITHVQTKLLRSQLDDAVDEVQEHLHKDGRSVSPSHRSHAEAAVQLVRASQDLARPGHGSPASGARTPSYPAGAAADVEHGSGSLMQQVQLLESVVALDLQGQAAHDVEAKMAPLRRTSRALREALNRASPTRPGPST